MKNLLFLMSALAHCFGVDARSEKFMEIIIPSYNNAAWYKKNLDSVLLQKYSNYHITYIDDCSTDGTADLVTNLIKEAGAEDRFTLIRNKERRGALENLYYAIYNCPDDAIVVTLDGDDWLAHEDVLHTLNKTYSKHDVWLTHGRLKETGSGWDGWCIAVPDKVVKENAFRSFRCPSHLRTFYAWLFKQIKKEDLMHEGKFFAMTWDQAIMFPMLEMAGERHAFMEDVLYIYNTTTSLSDNKVNPQLQRDLEGIIRSMPKYSRLPDTMS